MRLGRLKLFRKKRRNLRQEECFCDSCGIETHKVHFSLFGKKKVRALDITGQVYQGQCLLCNPPRMVLHEEQASSPPTQEVFVQRSNQHFTTLEPQEPYHEQEYINLNEGADEAASVMSEVTLDMRLLPEAVWDDLPAELQQQLSWDVVPEQHDTSHPSHQECQDDVGQENRDTTTNSPCLYLVYQQDGTLTTRTDLLQNETACCICASDAIDPNMVASIDSCQHLFCFDCIDKWSECENTCPLCKIRFQKIVRADMSSWPVTNQAIGRTTGIQKGQDEYLDLNLSKKDVSVSPQEDQEEQVVVKLVPDRKQPCNNNILAPFHARTAAVMSSGTISTFGDGTTSLTVATDSSLDSELVAQVYADIEGLESPASSLTSSPRYDYFNLNASYEATYEHDLMRRNIHQRQQA